MSPGSRGRGSAGLALEEEAEAASPFPSQRRGVPRAGKRRRGRRAGGRAAPGAAGGSGPLRPPRSPPPTPRLPRSWPGTGGFGAFGLVSQAVRQLLPYITGAHSRVPSPRTA